MKDINENSNSAISFTKKKYGLGINYFVNAIDDLEIWLIA